jgi:pyruvate/2-oxoglutarate dehydrogenase complex dihydrolipoamide acyltransferase (E2) component
VAQQIRFQLSADERVVSQDDATRWLDVFKSYLENPKVVLTGLAYTALEDY